MVPLRAERMEKLLGERIDEETATGILERLGFELRRPDDGLAWRCRPGATATSSARST